MSVSCWQVVGDLSLRLGRQQVAGVVYGDQGQNIFQAGCRCSAFSPRLQWLLLPLLIQNLLVLVGPRVAARTCRKRCHHNVPRVVEVSAAPASDSTGHRQLQLAGPWLVAPAV